MDPTVVVEVNDAEIRHEGEEMREGIRAVGNPDVAKIQGSHKA